MPGRSWLVATLYFFGMLLLFVGERLIVAGPLRAVSVAGAALVGLSLVLRAVHVRGARADARSVEKWLFALQAVGALSLIVYFLQSDLANSLFEKPLDATSPKLATALAALWPALWVASGLPILFGEMSYGMMARAPSLERGRIADALRSGLGLAGVLVFAFSVVYVASGRDKKVDLSYFHTARPGEATRKIVRTLDQPVKVTMFFPPANDVAEEVTGYFDELQKESKLIEVAHYDHAVDPTVAKDLGVSGNGIVVIARDKRKELFHVGLEIESARSNLQNLDKEMQKRLLQVSRPPRTVYLTVGHGERTRDPGDATDKRLTARSLREALTNQGVTVRDFGVAEGLAVDVPNDASAVVVLGPQRALLPEESASLSRYVERGGSLFLALDPEAGVDMHEVLGPLGVKFSTVTLANDQVYMVRTRQKSDRVNLASGNYSSHTSVQALAGLGMRAPIVFFGAGSLEAAKDKPKDVTVDFTVHAPASTWNDVNGNFELDAPAETRKAWELAAAITRKAAEKDKPDGRVLVLADSDALADGVIETRQIGFGSINGNGGYFLDGMRWLMHDEAITGATNSETDQPIAHTKKQDAIWFYGSIFLAPALTLLVGFIATRRRRRGTRAGAPATKEAAA